MKELFVTYDIALAMKELGFDEECCAIYRKSHLYPILGFEKFNSVKKSVIAAPLWQQCVDWFREKQNINVEINYIPNINKYGILTSVMDIKPRDLTRDENIKRSIEITNNFAQYDTYQEAREQAILKAIELCQKEK